MIKKNHKEVFICISLMASNVKHISKCLLVTCGPLFSEHFNFIIFFSYLQSIYLKNVVSLVTFLYFDHAHHLPTSPRYTSHLCITNLVSFYYPIKSNLCCKSISVFYYGICFLNVHIFSSLYILDFDA